MVSVRLVRTYCDYQRNISLSLPPSQYQPRSYCNNCRSESSRRLLTTLLLLDPGWGHKKLDLLIKFIFVHSVLHSVPWFRPIQSTTHLVFHLRIIDVLDMDVTKCPGNIIFLFAEVDFIPVWLRLSEIWPIFFTMHQIRNGNSSISINQSSQERFQ